MRTQQGSHDSYQTFSFRLEASTTHDPPIAAAAAPDPGATYAAMAALRLEKAEEEESQ